MAGNRQEERLARCGSFATGATRVALATASAALAALARAALASGVVALVFFAVVGAGRPAGAADLPELPSPTTTLPALSMPVVTVPVATVPPVTVPEVAPPVPVTVTAPRLDLPAPASSGTPVVTVPPGAAAPTTVVRSATSSASGSVRPDGPGGAVGDGARAGKAARRVDPSVRPLAFRLRRAAAETVQQLTFPLALALAMLAFLVFQHRVDKNDPKVAVPVETGDDDLLRFS